MISEFPRIMLYSHNTRGLGHANISAALAWAIYRRMPQASILYCSGSLHDLSALLPPNTDYVKLPSFDMRIIANKIEIVPARLQITREQQFNIRREILGSVARTFQPHIVLSDFYPAGKQQELIDALTWVKTDPARRVYLGFRDIIDDPKHTIKFLNYHLDFLRKYTDRVFVYGHPQVYDFITNYALPADVSSRTMYAGYVVNRGDQWRAAKIVRAQFGLQENHSLILVSAGGGKDSAELLMSVIRVYQRFANEHRLHWIIVSGPLVREYEWQKLQESIHGTSIQLIRYLPRLVELTNAADLFIGTCGYNIAAEIIATGTPAIFIPLPRPDEIEQTMRAEILHHHGICDVVHFHPEKTEQELANLLLKWVGKLSIIKKESTISSDGAEFVARCIEADWHQFLQ